MLLRWARAWWPTWIAFGRRNQSTVGIKGERLARRWLRRRGYRLVQQNLRLGVDEIDLLMWAPAHKALVIIEVKTRVIPDSDQGQRINPLDGLTPAKRARQIRAAERLVDQAAALRVPLRFDVVSVRLPLRGRPVIAHHVGAFDDSRQ